MWVQVIFDLPVQTPQQRKDAVKFRNDLLDLGFEMVQFSVYQRSFPGYKKADVFIGRVISRIPDLGRVNVLKFTDKQFSQGRNFENGSKKSNKKGSQLLLF